MTTQQPPLSSTPRPESLVFLRSNKPGLIRLFCFPYAGSGAMVYRSWSDDLSNFAEGIAVQYPGRENRLRVTPHASMQPLVQELVRDMLPYLDQPYAFFGHSLGGLIAFEVARELRRQNAALPAHLFISSRRAPHLPEPNSPISGLSHAEFARAVQERYNGIPKVIHDDPELLDIFLPTLKADFSVFETYRYHPEPAFDFPISGYYGIQDRVVDQAAISAWQMHTSLPMITLPFPGNHFYLQSHRSALLQSISQSLSEHINT